MVMHAASDNTRSRLESERFCRPAPRIETSSLQSTDCNEQKPFASSRNGRHLQGPLCGDIR